MQGATTEYYEQEQMFHGFIPHIMGTKFDLLLFHGNQSVLQSVWENICSTLERLDGTMNKFDPRSEVYALNSYKPETPLPVSDELRAILSLCGEYYERTCHLFDITLSDFGLVQLTEEGISFASPTICLDFGGFGKGYALKKIENIISEHGIAHAFVNFGNSAILGMGHHPYGDGWKVGFVNPYNGCTLHEFNLQNSALSTSGNTPQFYGHIIRPESREANRSMQASTVTDADPLEAEVLSTVWMIANEEEKNRIKACFPHMQATLYNL